MELKKLFRYFLQQLGFRERGPTVLVPLRGFPTWVLQELEFARSYRGEEAARYAKAETRRRF